MIFVDTNVLMYAVGGEHPLREEAREFFREALDGGLQLVTSAEVLQELMHAYLPVQRMETLDAALALADSCIRVVWPIEHEDVLMARILAHDKPGLGARDLMHLASCTRREVGKIKTFDRALNAAFEGS